MANSVEGARTAMLQAVGRRARLLAALDYLVALEAQVEIDVKVGRITTLQEHEARVAIQRGAAVLIAATRRAARRGGPTWSSDPWGKVAEVASTWGWP